MKKRVFPTLSSTELREKLRQRTFEELSVLTSLEQIFVQKRKHVFRMPRPGTPVILLVSGGLDSIINWDILLRIYKLKVYPLFLNKGEKRKNQEERSVDYFSTYFQGQFPDLFVAPYKHSTLIPQKEVLEELQTPFSTLVLENSGFPAGTTVNIFLGSPGIVPYYGMILARYLELKESVKIRTLFSSVMAGDGNICPSQSLTSLRTINLGMCTFTGDYSWQFTSLALETALKHHLMKEDFIQYSEKHHLPIEHTWSCYDSKSAQCGTCLACESRKDAFDKAGIKDKTVYVDRENSWKDRIKRLWRKVW